MPIQYSYTRDKDRQGDCGQLVSRLGGQDQSPGSLAKVRVMTSACPRKSKGEGENPTRGFYNSIGDGGLVILDHHDDGPGFKLQCQQSCLPWCSHCDCHFGCRFGRSCFAVARVAAVVISSGQASTTLVAPFGPAVGLAMPEPGATVALEVSSVVLSSRVGGKGFFKAGFDRPAVIFVSNE